MTPTWPRSPGYIFGALAGWLMFLACLAGVLYGRRQGWPEPALWALSAAPAALAALQFAAAYRLIARQDEFVRALTAKRMILAAGAVITLAVAWSSGELMGLPHAPAWLIYPLFWGLYGVITPLVRDTAA